MGALELASPASRALAQNAGPVAEGDAPNPGRVAKVVVRVRDSHHPGSVGGDAAEVLADDPRPARSACPTEAAPIPSGSSFDHSVGSIHGTAQCEWHDVAEEAGRVDPVELVRVELGHLDCGVDREGWLPGGHVQAQRRGSRRGALLGDAQRLAGVVRSEAGR